MSKTGVQRKDWQNRPRQTTEPFPDCFEAREGIAFEGVLEIEGSDLSASTSGKEGSVGTTSSRKWNTHAQFFNSI